MGAPPFAKEALLSKLSYSCDDEERWRQLELRLSAKFEEALGKSQPPAKFLLNTEGGVLLWSLVGSSVMLVIQNIFWAFRQLRPAWKALQNIYKYLRQSGASSSQPASHEDVCEAAMVLAAMQQEATREDVKEREKEISMRNWVRKAIGDTWKGTNTGTLPVTNCDALSIANKCSPHVVSSQDTVNTQMTVSVYLPNKTLKSSKEKEDFVAGALEHLPPHSSDLYVGGGSTFLSVTVSLVASTVEQLLDCATCLTKMGLSYDSYSTVQLGNTALLYGTSETGENVARTFLNEGIHDVPYIISAKGFKKRTIVIKGIYLENTKIKATTQNYGESTSLNVLYYRKLENGIEMFLAQLPAESSLKEGIYVHAKKTIQLEGCTIGMTLRSNDKQVDIIKQKYIRRVIGTLCTNRLWICLLVLYGFQALIVSPWHFFRLEWMLLLPIWILFYLLADYSIAPWAYRITIHCLEFLMRVKHSYYMWTPTELAHKKLSITVNVEDSRASKELKNRDDKKNLSIIENAQNSSALKNGDIPTISSIRQDDWTEDLHTPFTHLELHHGIDEDVDDSASINHSMSEQIETDMAVKDPSWEWPCLERTFRRGKWVIERTTAKVEVGSTAKWPFEVVTTVDPADGSESVQLIARSPHLIQVLKDSKPQTGTRFTVGSAIWPNELFLRLESLKYYLTMNGAEGAETSSVTTSSDSVWHVKHLVRFVERHFSDTLVQYERMKAEGCVSFELLWAFFVPGEGVCRKCLVTNQECFATVKRPAALKRKGQGITYYRLRLNVMDFNIQSYHRCTMDYEILSFDGEVPLTSLQVCPLRFFPNQKQMEARFLSVGAIFYQVAMQQPFCFMQFKGSMNFYHSDGGCWALRKLNADGRIMVDLLSFARMNPDYPLENAQPPCEVMTGLWSTTSQMKQPSDEELMLAPPFVYGFSFRLKKWGCFELCGLREISFNGGAFDALRMKDESQKIILLSLVKSYIGRGAGSILHNEQNIDPIANKGAGCIVLCHGPPGTGKTLTAEALAETMQCPLWSISAFELGEKPDVVEARLVQIMEIAYTWRAILLLDEADAYLQKRDEGVDVQRNLLTGVFLRVLEYHQGIMFLTTNRVTAFDDAILSRTTLAISYPALDETQRHEIWKKLLQRAGIQNVTYDALLHHDLNGRQIRNIVHLAQLLADGRKQYLDITHVIDAINASTSGIKELPLRAVSN